SIEFASTSKSREVLEFVDYDLIFVFQGNRASMKYIQGDAHPLPSWGRHTGGKHVLVDDTTAVRFACPYQCCREDYLPRFPAEGMCVSAGRQPKGNNVSWNVVRLDDIIHVTIIKVSPTTKLNVQLAPFALCANAIPGD